VRTFLFVILLSLAGCKTVENVHHGFDDADAWAQKFEDPARDEWQKPEGVIATFGLPPDAKVADIGSATGYFPVRFAKVVPKGHVYGADVESSMVDYLNRRAEREGLSNLTSILAEYADPKIPEPVDLVIVVNTYHHIEERTAYFGRLKASLRPGARLAIIDYSTRSKMGPPLEAKVPAEQVQKELEAAGYKLTATHDFLPEQYFLVFSAG
jgi:cyclopropane fatty-acyl-phospholipid synthase-like methyltransferase